MQPSMSAISKGYLCKHLIRMSKPSLSQQLLLAGCFLTLPPRNQINCVSIFYDEVFFQPKSLNLRFKAAWFQWRQRPTQETASRTKPLKITTMLGLGPASQAFPTMISLSCYSSFEFLIRLIDFSLNQNLNQDVESFDSLSSLGQF